MTRFGRKGHSPGGVRAASIRPGPDRRRDRRRGRTRGARPPATRCSAQAGGRGRRFRADRHRGRAPRARSRRPGGQAPCTRCDPVDTRPSRPAAGVRPAAQCHLHQPEALRVGGRRACAAHPAPRGRPQADPAEAVDVRPNSWITNGTRSPPGVFAGRVLGVAVVGLRHALGGQRAGRTVRALAGGSALNTAAASSPEASA